jgi:hypothetical protein
MTEFSERLAVVRATVPEIIMEADVTPPVTYEIRVTPGFRIFQTGKVPSRFHRVMMRLAFGWTFKIRSGE